MQYSNTSSGGFGATPARLSGFALTEGRGASVDLLVEECRSAWARWIEANDRLDAAERQCASSPVGRPSIERGELRGALGPLWMTHPAETHDDIDAIIDREEQNARRFGQAERTWFAAAERQRAHDLLDERIAAFRMRTDGPDLVSARDAEDIAHREYEGALERLFAAECRTCADVVAKASFLSEWAEGRDADDLVALDWPSVLRSFAGGHSASGKPAFHG